MINLLLNCVIVINNCCVIVINNCPNCPNSLWRGRNTERKCIPSATAAEKINKNPKEIKANTGMPTHVNTHDNDHSETP